MIGIIGAGAAGLVCALELAKRGEKVQVFEKNRKIGRKILATGNGRCNITNQNIHTTNYHGLNPSFVNPSINHFNTEICKKFFSELGIEMVEGQKGRLYPKSQQSSSVVDLLVYECKRLEVEFHLESEVIKIEKKEQGFILYTEDKSLHIKKLLIATGGLAMPSLGSCESGYSFAKSFGHTIIEPFASLTQLITQENLKSISGVKCEGSISVYSGKEVVSEQVGDILFTDYGVSGSAILDISRSVAENLRYEDEVSISLDLASEYNYKTLENLLLKRKKHANNKSIELWLNGFINSKLAKYIARFLSEKSANELNTKDVKKLVYLLKKFRLKIVDTKGFKTAEVTAGGVLSEEVNATTLESKLQENLYFAGEVLDVDGDCGGYNLHWAWASGYNAAVHMAK